MPNWVRGDLKVRGTKENIKRFLLEGLNEGVVEVICDDEFDFAIESEIGIFYINGTNRHFIDTNMIETSINCLDDEEDVIVLENFKSAWIIDVVQLAYVSSTYNIDLKILGFECGMEFCQDVEIVQGEIVLNNVIEYDDYQWECIRPHIGG